MSSQVSNHKATNSDPTLVLQQALHSFEETLTDEQKHQYHAGKKAPDAASVIEFVAQIDSRNGKTSRRCVGPQLCALLDATQQFSGVVDTFVSSHPEIAALVWGGVKTAILTANNVATYFEKVTGMAMIIGKTCPTYQQFGPLYPGCVDLQHALCDYYAVIIRLCTRVIEITRRPAWTQTIASIFSPFASEFQPFLDDLKKATKMIGLQIRTSSCYRLQDTLPSPPMNHQGFRQRISIALVVELAQLETQQNAGPFE